VGEIAVQKTVQHVTGVVDAVVAMLLLVINVLLNALVTFTFATSDAYPVTFGLIVGVFWFVQAMGALLVGADSARRLGFALVCIGSLPFLPLAFMAIAGARSMLREAETREAFEAV